MNESDLRHTLLLQAVETTDGGQASTVWTPQDAAWASGAARREVGEQAAAPAFLVRRAQLGLRRLAERNEAWRRLVDRPAGPGPLWAVLLLCAAYFVGMAGDSFTASRRVDLLPQTLLTVLLLAWNMGVFAALLVALLRRPAHAAVGAPRQGPWRGLVALFERVAARPRLRGSELAQATAAQARFIALHAAATRTLRQRRAMALLHAAAALLTLGVVSSMYLRGLVFDYRAGWDSTFLDAHQVHALLGTVLGPASAVTGIGLPEVSALARLRWADGGGEGAARWIHLYALTLLGAVVLPRLLLAGWAALRARQAATQLALPLDDPYFVRLRHAALATPQPATVLPYSYQLGAAQQAGLTAALADVLGEGVQPQLVDSLPLGAEDDLPQALPANLADQVVALFALTATPERETHGAFVRALVAALPPRCTLQVVIDESGFRQHLGRGADADARLQQRRESWRNLLHELSVAPPHFVDLNAGAAR